MEENLSFDGEFFFLKLESCSSMEVEERVLERELFWGWRINERMRENK